MTEFRENLLTRMIHIYGFEHEATIAFANLLEKAPQKEAFDKELQNIVQCLEADPTLDKVFTSLVKNYIKW